MDRHATLLGMGNWIIEIRGHGIHHNKLPGDANAIALEAVKKLLAVDGTTVDYATFETTAPTYQRNPDNREDLVKLAAEDHE